MDDPAPEGEFPRPSKDEVDEAIRKHERWLETGGEKGEKASL